MQGYSALLHLKSLARESRYGLRFERGFTLVELIVAMIVAGILATTVLPRLAGNHGFEERGFRDEIAAALRYAQKSAIAARRLVCVNFSATGLTVRVANAANAANCTAGADLIGPNGSLLTVTATGSVSFSSLPAALTFDALGRPNSGAPITITVSNLPSVPIVVEAETGYVH